MIVIGQNIVLTADEAAHPNSPVIGADNIVVSTNIAADTEAGGYPATNLANPATDLEWRAADTTEQYLTVTTNTADDISYVGIAGHNLGTAAIPVSVEGDDGSGFDELVAPSMLPDDRPALFRFTPAPYQAIRLRLQSGDDPAAVAVLYVGNLLVVPRRIYVGHTPITYAREPIVINDRSQNGKYLGSIETGLTNKTTIALRTLDPDWYRDNLDVVVSSRQPFFFVWRPFSYPKETGYVWPTGSVKPTNAMSNGMMAVSIPVEGDG